MSKRFGLVLVVLLIVPMLLSACSTESRDVAENYLDALFKGDSTTAQKYACDSFQDQTAALADQYGMENIHKKDLKFDIGKGNNQEEIIVTGSYWVGPTDDADEVELAASVRVIGEEERDTRIVLWMKDDGGDWCVSDKSDFGDGVSVTSAAPADSEPMTTEEPAADATQAAE